MFTNNPLVAKGLFIVAVILCLTPWIDPPLALLMGFIVAQTIGIPFVFINSKAISVLLKVSVIGLGFGMNLMKAMEAGREGIVFTVISITGTLLGGWLLGRWLKVEWKTSFLISTGTAICGGSAIAAVSPIVKANENQISVALGAVFILNSVALFIFPPIGGWLHLTQHQFGLWSAIAIHDTSSVVGASSKFGAEALQVATTVKLERALWIIPISLVTAFVQKERGKKIQIPWFIAYFIVAMCISTYLPYFNEVYAGFVMVAKKGLTLTLFLIGAGLSVSKLKSVGMKPFFQAIVLWFFIGILSLSVLYF